MMFEAISERPILNDLTPEARLREKLKFFNLEKEDLAITKKRISKRMSNIGQRFMDAENSAKGKGGGAVSNLFSEMIAIEQDYGSLFATKEDLER